MEAVEKYRYNARIFMFPTWPEIYQHEEERKQGFDEAVRTYEAMVIAYQECGYQGVEVPKTSVSERADFIVEFSDSPA